ncbi:MAG: hypothetical protein PWQ82_307 [Thermosediminibacterales bacterium]|nr:hypothetical protein [Thermosediminibacterales bacterium]MDK2836411.1 hypothetical protein [Thermosediminibacterales bacterium]
MDESIKTRSLVEGALLSAVTIILSIASLYIPVLGVFISFFWPVPIILLGIRHGLKISILATVVSGLVVAMLAEPVQAFTVILGFGLIGVTLGYALRKDFSPGKTLFVGSIASLISKVILVGITLAILNINPITQQVDLMKEAIDHAVKLYSSMGIDADRLETFKKSFNQMADMIGIVIPGLFVMASVLDTFLNYTIARLVLNRLGQKIENFPPLKYWQMPTYTVALFLTGIILMMFYNIYKIDILRFLGVNLQMVFSFVFIIQGLALLSYFLNKFRVSKVFRVIIIFLFFFNPLFSQLLLWGGMLDILFDFRKLKTTR